MYIQEIECNNCHRKGWPGDLNFKFCSGFNFDFCECNCGNKVISSNMKDQSVLSENLFVRLEGLSNYTERGEIYITPGNIEIVKFREPVDLIIRMFFTPLGSGILVNKVSFTKTGVRVVAGKFDDEPEITSPVEVNYSVYGIQNPSDFPIWYMQFYNGATNFEKGV